MLTREHKIYLFKNSIKHTCLPGSIKLPVKQDVTCGEVKDNSSSSSHMTARTGDTHYTYRSEIIACTILIAF